MTLFLSARRFLRAEGQDDLFRPLPGIGTATGTCTRPVYRSVAVMTGRFGACLTQRGRKERGPLIRDRCLRDFLQPGPEIRKPMNARRAEQVS